MAVARRGHGGLGNEAADLVDRDERVRPLVGVTSHSDHGASWLAAGEAQAPSVGRAFVRDLIRLLSSHA